LKGDILLKDVQGTSYIGEFGKYKNVFEIVTPNRNYHMKSPSKDESNEWVEALKSIIDRKSSVTSNVNHSSNANHNHSSNANHNQSDKVGENDFMKIKVVGKGAFGKVYLVKKKRYKTSFCYESIE